MAVEAKVAELHLTWVQWLNATEWKACCNRCGALGRVTKNRVTATNIGVKHEKQHAVKVSPLARISDIALAEGISGSRKLEKIASLVRDAAPEIAILFFDPDSLRDHLGSRGGALGDWVEGQTDETLTAVGVEAASAFDGADDIWSTYGQCVAEAAREASGISAGEDDEEDDGEDDEDDGWGGGDSD